jgi:glucokinase
MQFSSADRRAASASANMAIGVDIGGTAIKLGAVDRQGVVLAQHTLSFRGFLSFPALADALVVAIQALAGETGRRVHAIGVASPGHPDPLTGYLASGAYNVALLRGQSVLAALRERGQPATLALNDGVAAAMGEARFGAAIGLSRFALITLGTGVGGCIIIDGRPVVGQGGQPPEIGAMVLDVNGPASGNLLPGTLEAYASATGFAVAFAAEGGTPGTPPEQIFAAAQAGSLPALAAIDSVCRRIAQAFGGMINLLNLEACLIGGGISQGGSLLLDGVQRNLSRFTWPPLLRPVQTRLAATGNAAGLLGAAAAAFSGL